MLTAGLSGLSVAAWHSLLIEIRRRTKIMYVTLRKALLVSTMGVCGLVSAPVGFSLVATGPAHPFAMSALASGDDDNSGRGGSDDRGGDDRDDNDDHGGNSGRGSDHDDNDNDNDDDNDHRGRNGHDNDDNDDDDRDDDRDNDRDDRDEVTLNVSEGSLRGLRDGSLVAVDNLGRALEVEVEFEHGLRVVTVKPHGGDARRNPGPITSVSILPASAR
jgi:hypothetical protein